MKLFFLISESEATLYTFVKSKVWIDRYPFSLRRSPTFNRELILASFTNINIPDRKKMRFEK